MKVAFFDSGIGGLCVLNEALKHFSGIEFLYFADTKNVPYGTKTKDEIISFSLEAVDFLVSCGAKAVVIACNTATSAAIVKLREKFDIPIIGMEPAIKVACDRFQNRPALLIATPLTIKGEKLSHLIEKIDANVWNLPLPKLVEFAENQEFNSQNVKNYVKDEFSKFNLNEISSLVLGCTHFNYFKDTFREILPKNVHLIDGIDGTINRLIHELGKNKFGDINALKYFHSFEEANEKDMIKIQKYLTRLDEMRVIN